MGGSQKCPETTTSTPTNIGFLKMLDFLIDSCDNRVLCDYNSNESKLCLSLSPSFFTHTLRRFYTVSALN